MNFIQAVASSEKDYTANGAVTPKSTGSMVLDLFSRLPTMRTASEREIKLAFDKAWAEDPLLTLKTLFYTRDVRKGQGERRVFRVLWKYLLENEKATALRNIGNVPIFGRWDDLFEDLSNDTLEYIAECLDLANDAEKLDKPSFINLLYKWLPSENTSSKETCAKAKKIREYLKLTSKSYRKMLTAGRKKANIIEALMSAKKWDEINYSHVPSQASRIYRKAFGKHDTERYGEFIKKALTGEVKINSAVSYPYEIVREYLKKGSADDSTLEALWRQLPDYVNGDYSAIVVADVSGSMTSPDYLPISVCISLAMYFAERNKNGVFGNKFITFSERPELQDVTGRTLYQRIQNLSKAAWSMNTDLMAVFKLILNAAVKNQLPASEMPKKIIIVSDMQFDQATRNNKKSNFEKIEQMYAEAGYARPTLVFWTVGSDSSTKTSPVTMDENGTYLIAGCSPSIFKNALNSVTTTPYDLMVEVLNDDRYASVTI